MLVLFPAHQDAGVARGTHAAMLQLNSISSTPFAFDYPKGPMHVGCRLYGL